MNNSELLSILESIITKEIDIKDIEDNKLYAIDVVTDEVFEITNNNNSKIILKELEDSFIFTIQNNDILISVNGDIEDLDNLNTSLIYSEIVNWLKKINRNLKQIIIMNVIDRSKKEYGFKETIKIGKLSKIDVISDNLPIIYKEININYDFDITRGVITPDDKIYILNNPREEHFRLIASIIDNNKADELKEYPMEEYKVDELRKNYSKQLRLTTEAVKNDWIRFLTGKDKKQYVFMAQLKKSNLPRLRKILSKSNFPFDYMYLDFDVDEVKNLIDTDYNKLDYDVFIKTGKLVRLIETKQSLLDRIKEAFGHNMQLIKYKGIVWHKTTIIGLDQLFNNFMSEGYICCSTPEGTRKLINKNIVNGDEQCVVAFKVNGEYKYSFVDGDSGKNMGYDEIRIEFNSENQLKNAVEDIFVANDFDEDKLSDYAYGVWEDIYFNVAHTTKTNNPKLNL